MSVSINGAGSISGIDQGLNVTGGAIVGGGLTVTGVLTYDDVTNIDSIGIVTARSGLQVTSGNVGIGTDNPTSDLQVVSYGDHGKIRVESSGDGNRAGIEFFRESSSGPGKGGAGIWVESETGNSSGELRFGTANNASLQSLSTKMILDVNGNIGIGTDNPFDATGYKSITLAGSTGGAIAFREGATTRWEIYGDNSNGIRFYDRTNTTERLRIGSDGQIGLGGANYGTNNQVITSTGTGSAPEWRGVNAAFYGKQDTEHNVATSTWTVVKNLGNDAVNTTGWNESTGVFTANADTAGTWYIFGCAGIDDVQAHDIVYMGVMVNGANPPVFTHSRAHSTASNAVHGGVMVARVVTLADGDTVSIGVYHNEGTTEPTEPNRCFVGGFRLSV